jgi:hypothetical protein
VQSFGFAWRSVTLAAYAAIAPSLPRLAIARSFRKDVADLGVRQNNMTISNTSRCVWAPTDFLEREIPETAKIFLVSRGLPDFVGATAIEFGIYDSDPSSTVSKTEVLIINGL